MDEAKGRWVSYLLLGVLALMIGWTSKYIYAYYRGPERVVDVYIQALNERNYADVYKLFDSEEINCLGDKSFIVDYYKKVYQNNFRYAKKIAQQHDLASIEIYSAKGTVQQSLTLKYKKKKWYLAFPFEASSVQVKAPNGSKVQMDGRTMEYVDNGNFMIDHILPGKYIVSVQVPDETIKKYYGMVQVPQETIFDTPYEVQNVEVSVPKGMEIQFSVFDTISEGYITEFKNVLEGNYRLTVTHPKGYIERVEKNIEVHPESNVIELGEFTLSDKGKEQLGKFMKAFYNDYHKAIVNHDANCVEPYFMKQNEAVDISAFKQWFIEEKDIKSAKLNITYGTITINDQGELRIPIYEDILLNNYEQDEIFDEWGEKEYRVIIGWDTLINLNQESWQIASRSILESMVAVKDKDGRWIQY